MMKPKDTIYVANCIRCLKTRKVCDLTKVVNFSLGHNIVYYCGECIATFIKNIEKDPIKKGPECDACSTTFENQEDLKTLEIHPNETTVTNYMICKNCWFDDLNDITAKTPIAYAARQNKQNIVKILLQDYRLNPEEDDGDVIYYMCTRGHEEVVKILLKDERVNPELTLDKFQGLSNTYKYGHLNIVEILLRDGRCDPTKLEEKLIEALIEIGDKDLVEKILKDERVKLYGHEWVKIWKSLLSKYN